jgi:hypothetical protein
MHFYFGEKKLDNIQTLLNRPMHRNLPKMKKTK